MKKKIIIITILAFIVDRLTKIFVVNNFLLHNSTPIIKDILYITRTENTGAAFSLFNNSTIFLIIISFLLIGFILYLIFTDKKLNVIKTLLYGILLGGVLGNLFDRIIYGYVIDFIDVPFINFAIFNFGDIFIVVSTISYLIYLYIKEDKNEI